MAKPPLRKAVKINKAIPKSNPEQSAQTDDSNTRVEKLETLLAEKNKNIQLLQKELTVFIVQVREFDKLKNLLEEEIYRLKEQNRIFRSELGIPANQVKEGAII